MKHHSAIADPATLPCRSIPFYSILPDTADGVRVGVMGSGEGNAKESRLTDEDGSDGERNTLLVDIRLVLSVQHSIKLRNLSVLISDDGEVEGWSVGVERVDVFDPAGVGVDVVGGKTDQLGVSDSFPIYQGCLAG